jgi:hypothetical protein
VDDSPADSVVPQGESQESLSESHEAKAMASAATNAESTQALTISSNGSSPRKIEANRRNAKKSTGPKTSRGKTISSWNSTRHGLLAERLPSIPDKDKKHFARLLSSLRQDLEPVGTVEEVLVERIAQEYWRLGVAARHEAEEPGRPKPFGKTSIDRILRYETMINRQLYQAINQLERLQRLRKGENVPPPLNLQVLQDARTILDEEKPDQ